MDGKIKERTVKRRIFLSNALMILVTLGLIAAVNGVIIKVYWEAMEQKWQFSMEETLGDPANMEMLIKEWTVHQHSFYVLLLVDALICVGTLILVSLLFTRNLEQHIREPLEILEDGAKRIRGNVLTEEISYRGDAEFEEICTAFNEMQSHVLLEQEKNRKYEKARTEMIAGISHDLRTPLTAVRGTIKGLLDGVVTEPNLQAKFLQTAYRRTGDMDVLLNQLFYLSKLETGSMPLNLQKADLAEFIRSYAEGKQSILDETKIQLRTVLEVQTALVQTDLEQMQRIFDNLLENSRKYAQAEKLEVCILLKETEKSIQIGVSDNGSGVPEEQLSHLFEEFYRGDASRGKKEGNGLGLYIVKCLMEAMGGSVRAENAGGLCIWMKLPKGES